MLLLEIIAKSAEAAMVVATEIARILVGEHVLQTMVRGGVKLQWQIKEL